MRPPRGLAALKALRQQPLWRLLAADKAPVVMAVLQQLLLEDDKTLPSSVLSERLARALDELRGVGEDLPQGAQGYVADWLRQGWLLRRLPPGASEEEYELSSDAAQAIRFVTSLRERRVVATESRLSVVLRELAHLAQETDPNPETRVAALVAERDRLDREIDGVRRGVVAPVDDGRATERAREIIALAGELAADFRRVRDDFDELNRSLRQSLMEHEGSRGEVLEALFAGVDVIGESDAGKTFSAFWKLLMDPEQSEVLREALDALASRAFMARLSSRERRFLSNLTALLTREGTSVHDVLQSFARSLKSFVQSREFLEQRRLHALLRKATQLALGMGAAVRPNQEVGYGLTLTTGRIRSASQYALHDPAERAPEFAVREAGTPDISLELVSELVRNSEIDFRTLRRNVRRVLERQSQATMADVLATFPAEQGLGSIVGYVALGARHGEVTPQQELVHWQGSDAMHRWARVPAICFIRERYDELVD